MRPPLIGQLYVGTGNHTVVREAGHRTVLVDLDRLLTGIHDVDVINEGVFRIRIIGGYHVDGMVYGSL